MFTKYPEVYEKELAEVYQLIEKSEVVEQFDRQAHRVAFSQIPGVFVGFSASTSRAEKVNDLIKAKIPYEVGVLKVISAVTEVMDALGKKGANVEIDKVSYEDLFRNDRLKDLRLRLHRKIFRLLLEAYVRSLSYTVR